MLQRLGIIGSGDLGQLIAYHAATDGHYEIAGFFDDYKEKGALAGKYPVLGGVNDVEEAYRNKQFDCLMIGIGYKHFAQRMAVFERFQGKIPYGRIVHTSAYTDASSKIGEGAFILPGCILDTNVVIEENVLLNTGCCIAHDSTVRQHTFLSPRVVVAGFVSIGKCCNIGINTTVIDNITIADHVQTGGATVVIRDIQEKGLYVGNPARFIR